MSNNRYLEFDSSYRNRNDWPLASQFQIPISQSGRKDQFCALDPVCLATPIMTWTSNNLSSTGSSHTLTGTILINSSPELSYTSDNQTFLIKTTTANVLQQLENYYTGLVITLTTGTGTVISRRRIIGYKYLLTNPTPTTPPLDYDLGLITISSSFPEGVIDGVNFSIADPTDVTTSTSNPYIFVPTGRVQKNAYTGYYLYNENLKEYRYIGEYDTITHMITLNTSGTTSYNSGPLTRWSNNHNYCIRKHIPYLPSNSSLYPTPIGTITTNSITISGLQQTHSNAYKNYAIRIVANFSILEYYNYINNQIAPSPLNESRTISSSSYNAGNTTLTFYPPLNGTPTTNSYIEILSFSYDNFNPFTYTGSLVSQQDMVCYEVELINLILPNEVLAVGEGGRIAFYPYVYVQISNVSASCGGLKNIIYSNNPNSVNAIFRVPIDDVINPIISTFIKVDGDGMVQTIKFKPNDNLYFSVFLSNGELYKTVLPEYYSPSLPNPASQISASFSIRRL